ncbi:MAG: TAXI family TRAP transporter solute-binding subunit [Alphaproteobacteria bacterium]
MKRWTIPVLALAAFAAAAPSIADDGKKPQQVTIFTGPQGGSWYAMGGGFAKLFSDSGVRANAEVGGGISNVAVVSQGRGELGFTMSIVPRVAEEGQEPYKQKITNVRGIAGLGPNLVHIVVAASSGVTTVKDLKGKKFASQPVGNVTTEAFKAVLAANGMSEADLDLTRGGQGYGAAQLKDRRIIGFTATTLPPSPAFSEAAQSVPVVFLPIDDATLAKMRESNPGYTRAVIKAGTYNGQAADVPTASTDLLIITRAETPEPEAYWMTKVLIEKIADLRKIHSSLGDLTPKSMARTPGIALHPGAMRYYKEKGML